MFLEILANLNVCFQDIMDSLEYVTKLSELFFFIPFIYAFALVNFAFEISEWMVSITPPN